MRKNEQCVFDSLGQIQISPDGFSIHVSERLDCSCKTFDSFSSPLDSADHSLTLEEKLDCMQPVVNHLGVYLFYPISDIVEINAGICEYLSGLLWSTHAPLR